MPSSTTTTTSTGRPNRSRKSSSLSVNRTSTTAAPLSKTQILIHVYDLLPPGRLSSFLWTIGSSLLHTGLVINNREYAYGGHSKRGLTGVYWTKPRLEPPGGTFRLEILQGFTFRSAKEVEAIVREVSNQFLGPSYNLLTHNCNHFTNALCERLTSRAAPAWLNRAARIGVTLPCVVPREWMAPLPEYESAEGELLAEEEEEEGEAEGPEGEYSSEEEEEEEEDSDERAGMLDSDRRRSRRKMGGQDQQRRRDQRGLGGSRGGRTGKDSAGRVLPAAERAPLRRP